MSVEGAKDLAGAVKQYREFIEDGVFSLCTYIKVARTY